MSRSEKLNRMENIQQYDWQGNLRLNMVLLRFMGLWPKGEGTYKMDLYALYSFVIVGSCVGLHISSLAINVYFLRDNLQVAVSALYMVLTGFISICKTFLLIKNMKILKQCIVDIGSSWFQPRNARQTLLIQPSIKFWKANFNTLQVMAIFSNLFWTIYPIMENADERRLPFPAWYPFDFRISPLYEVTYIFQMVSTMYLSWLHINVDLFISGFNVYTACHFDMLSDSLRNIARTYNNVLFDVRKELIQCIIHHQKILSFAGGCYQFYKWVVCLAILMTGLCMGMAILQSTFVVPFTIEFYSLLAYGTAMVVQIFIYCWFGNEVEVKSNLVSYAAFEANWTDLPDDFKKDLTFFVMNVLQPMKISAFNIFQLSLDTFVKIIKASWSYFMLLNQL